MSEVSKEDRRKTKAMYISRSSYIAMALATKMQAEDMMSVLPELKLAKEQQLRDFRVDAHSARTRSILD